MKQSPVPSMLYKHLVNSLQASLATLALCTPLVLIISTPAQAGWRDIFRGETSGAASGRPRGGGIRDTRCLINETAQVHQEEQNLEYRHDDEQIVALLPGTEQATSQSTPTFFLYVPFDRYGDPMEMVFELATQGANEQRQIIDSISLLLPDNPGLVKFQLPANIALDNDQIYDWSFRLKCSTDEMTEPLNTAVVGETVGADSDSLEASDLNISILAPAASQSTTPRAGKVLQEVFGTMRFIESPTQLVAAQTTPDITDDYQAYVDNDMWLDLVPTLAATSSSDFQFFLQEEFSEYKITVDVDTTGASVIERLEPENLNEDDTTVNTDSPNMW